MSRNWRLPSGVSAPTRWLAATGAILATSGALAANWQMILSEAGRRMEIDRTSIRKTEDDKVLAWARIQFDKPVTDTQTGKAYSVIEALNRYDCNSRSFTTIKRIYRKDEHETLREEENKTPAELPVRSGTLDERILKIACRPGGMAGIKQDFEKVVKDANEAAAEMRRTNEEMVRQAAKKEERKDGRKEILKTELGERKASPPAAAAQPASRTSSPRAQPPVARRSPRKPALEAAVDIPWAYDGAGGPEQWARLKPEYRLCGSGRRQSPIDLTETIRVDQPEIDFRYRPSPFRIADTDHAVEVAVADNGFALLGKEYRLVRVHFHRPGEHRIDGRGFAMSAHFEHRSEDGQIAMVAVNLVPGREHPVIQTLWNHLPLERYEVVAPPAASVDFAQLLPSARGYFHTMGSLSIPPCTEGVVWLVMKQPVEISPEQIAIFARLHAANARPIQPAQGRRIKESR